MCIEHSPRPFASAVFVFFVPFVVRSIFLDALVCRDYADIPGLHLLTRAA